MSLPEIVSREEWEEPKGRSAGLGAPAGSDRIRYPDEYDD